MSGVRLDCSRGGGGSLGRRGTGWVVPEEGVRAGSNRPEKADSGRREREGCRGGEILETGEAEWSEALRGGGGVVSATVGVKCLPLPLRPYLIRVPFCPRVTRVHGSGHQGLGALGPARRGWRTGARRRRGRRSPVASKRSPRLPSSGRVPAPPGPRHATEGPDHQERPEERRAAQLSLEVEGPP